MSREENLTRRLCAYLDLTIEIIRGSIVVIYPLDSRNDITDELIYETFHDALFDKYPRRSLCNILEWKFCAWGWNAAVRKAFEFSSLEELELKLEVRGF